MVGFGFGLINRKKKRNKSMKKIKKYFGEILTVIGGFITTYNVFDFHYGRPIRWLKEHYYYLDKTLYCIAVGVSLMVIGILIIRNKKK